MGCGKKDNIGGTSHHHEGCVSEVVKAILDIQNQAVNEDCDTCGTSCFLEPLGGLAAPARKTADTRVFMLLTPSGLPFFAFYTTKHGKVLPSIFFRVEDVFDNCATLRVLAACDEDGDVSLSNKEETGVSMGLLPEVLHFKKTETCLTVDLSFFAGIQCVRDVDLNICCD